MSKLIFLEPIPFHKRFDLSSLDGKGEIVHLFERGTSTERKVSIFSEEFSDCLLDRLEDIGYNHRTDYIVMAGDLAALCIASVVLGSEYGRVKLFLFDAVAGSYTEIVVGREFDAD